MKIHNLTNSVNESLRKIIPELKQYLGNIDGNMSTTSSNNPQNDVKSRIAMYLNSGKFDQAVNIVSCFVCNSVN